MSFLPRLSLLAFAALGLLGASSAQADTIVKPVLQYNKTTQEVSVRDNTNTIALLCTISPGLHKCLPSAVVNPSDLNVASYNAPLNGTSDDSPAFSSARTAAANGQTIKVPAGGQINLASGVSGGPAGVLWDIQGNLLPGGGAPLVEVGNDTTTTMIYGKTKMYSRRDALPDLSPVLRVDRNWATNVNTGSTGATTPAFQANCYLPGGQMVNYVWCNQTQLINYDTGNGQHVAVSALAASRGGGSAPTWAGYFEARDENAGVSSTLHGIENDIYANGLDNTNKRILLQMQIGKLSGGAADMSVSRGLSIGRNDSTAFVGKGIEIALPWTSAALDFTAGTAVGGAPAVRLASGHSISFTATNDRYLQYAPGAFQYVYNGSGAFGFQVYDGGGFRLPNLASDPGVGHAGEMYFNTSTGHPKYFNGSAWVQL